MASPFSLPILPFIFFLLISFSLSDSDSPLQSPQLSSLEQEALYQILESINSTFNWRFNHPPDDFCYSSPHGVVCDFFANENNPNVTEAHVTELSLGYISDSSPNPTCSPTATFSYSLTFLPYLRKLFFYNCFTATQVILPGYLSNLTSLEQLVFIENPSLFGSLGEGIGNLKHLKKLVFSGTNVSGEIPNGVGELVELEQLTLRRNHFNGELKESLGNLKKLRVLDLSLNGFKGNVTDSIGEMTELFQLDMSSNQFNGKIPESLVKLKRLEFLDLSYNRFANNGIPLFLAEMTSLKEVYLSGNQLGGPIPEIWGKLGGILGIGLSEVGLVGEIPASMAMFLKNVNYLSLDNNKLEGIVPEEFGTLETVLSELNLENNLLSGRLPFSAKFGGKLKVGGNRELCVNARLVSAKGHLKLCKKPVNPNPVFFSESSSSSLRHCSFCCVFLLGVWFLSFGV